MNIFSNKHSSSSSSDDGEGMLIRRCRILKPLNRNSSHILPLIKKHAIYLCVSCLRNQHSSVPETKTAFPNRKIKGGPASTKNTYIPINTPKTPHVFLDFGIHYRITHSITIILMRRTHSSNRKWRPTVTEKSVRIRKQNNQKTIA